MIRGGMHRYTQGTNRLVSGLLSRALKAWKASCGVLSDYAVWRPDVDHSVFAVDNRELPTTVRRRARLYHRVSCDGSLWSREVVEFEHASALIGHVDTSSDYEVFRKGYASRLERLLEQVDPSRHRLLAPSKGALRSLTGAVSVDPHVLEAIRVVPWSTASWECEAWENMPGRLRVFHYAGYHPYAKGTHDVLAVARRLPDVEFVVSGDAAHPVFANKPGNVHVLPVSSARLYRRALRSSDVLVCPTYADGWGVFLDGLGGGRPIVCYDSYDKTEAVQDGVSGVVVALPKPLSFCDSLVTGCYRNWQEYCTLVLRSQDDARVSQIAGALGRYSESPGLLEAHARGSRALYRLLHLPAKRMKTINGIYRELLEWGVYGREP